MAGTRIVQWTTGQVARHAVKSVLERPGLDLVGAYAFSADKVGRDVGDLIGLGRTVGVQATDDIQALIDLKPDCVLYMPLHLDLEHMTRLLRAGINIVTTAGFVTGRAVGAAARTQLHEAALAGGASLFGTGIHPGHTDYLAAVASGMSAEVNYVRVLESIDLSLWAADANQDEFGWGRPAGDPGHAEDIEKATAVDIDSLDVLAVLFGFELTDIRCEVEFAVAGADLDIPGRPIRAGHVAGIDIRWIGSSADVDVVEVNLRWTLGSNLEPAWEVGQGFLLELRGNPCVTVRLDILPADIESMTIEEMAGTGRLMTAMPAVNAIPLVVSAPPGIITYADLPPITSRLVPKRAAR
ncbi:MAG: dihydrodipicolinate reductase [Mycobacterium sp.]